MPAHVNVRLAPADRWLDELRAIEQLADSMRDRGAYQLAALFDELHTVVAVGDVNAALFVLRNYEAIQQTARHLGHA